MTSIHSYIIFFKSAFAIAFFFNNEGRERIREMATVNFHW